jgi:hypothetical protein
VQTFTLRKQKGVGLTREQEAFVWVSERPREGRPAEPGGLRMRGDLADRGPASGGRTTVSVRIIERLPDGLGMDAFADITSDATPNLHRVIKSYRHCRDFGLIAAQRQALRDIFHSVVEHRVQLN